MVTKKINITVEEGLLIKFKEYCEKNCMKLSTRLQYLMKNDLERHK